MTNPFSFTNLNSVADAIRAEWLAFCAETMELDDDGEYLNTGYRRMAKAAIAVLFPDNKLPEHVCGHGTWCHPESIDDPPWEFK